MQSICSLIGSNLARRGGALAFCLTMFLGVSAVAQNPCDIDFPIPEDIERYIVAEKTFRCFFSEDGVQSHLKAPLQKEFNRQLDSSYQACPERAFNEAGLWLAEKMGEAYAKSTSAPTSEKLCSSLSEIYAREFIKELGKGVEEEASERGVSGTRYFVSNLISDHANGHFDFSEMAFEESLLDHGFVEKEFAKAMVALASVDVDDAMWEQENYHAHTPNFTITHSGPDAESLKQSISSGKKQFIDRIREHLSKLNKIVADQNDDQYDDVLYHMGVVLHLVQDLVFHNGMTLRQHAGLQFLKENANPDVIQDPEKRKLAEANAVAISRIVLDQCLFSRSDEVLQNILNWEPDETSGNPFDVVESYIKGSIDENGFIQDSDAARRIYVDSIKENKMTIFRMYFGYMSLPDKVDGDLKDIELADENIVRWTDNLDGLKDLVNDAVSICNI